MKQKSVKRINWVINPQEFPGSHLASFLKKTGEVWQQAAGREGFRFRFVESPSVSIHVDSEGPTIRSRSEDLLESRELFIVDDISGNPASLAHLDAIARVVELSDSVLLNSCMQGAEWLKRDKLSEIALAAKLGLQVPKTVVVGPPPHGRESIENVIEVIGRGPYVLKMRESGTGFGILYLETLEQLQSSIDLIGLTPKGFIVQEFVPQTLDIRLAFVSGKFVASLIRTPRKGNIISNLARGGIAGNLSDSGQIDELKRQASLAVSELKADYLCVDFLVGPQSAVFCEWGTVMADFSSFSEPDRTQLSQAFFDWAARQLE